MSGDLFEPITMIEIPEKRRFDWIVCNPPYIKNVERDSLSPDVRDHEPEIALFAGEDGLAVIRRLISEAPQYLAPNGKLLFEIGATQAEPVLALIDAEPAYCTYELLKDYAKKDRLVLACVSSEHIPV
jgi:release factor glutamine methyltransferase